MRKSIILVGVVMVMLVVASMNAAASSFDAEKMDFVGGFTYNTFDGTITEDGNKTDELKDELKSGIGYYFGGRYLVNENIKVGLGYDSASSSYTDGNTNITETVSISGPYVEAVYGVNENINISAAAVSYGLTYSDDNATEDLANGSGLGFKVGGEYNYNYNEQMAITGGVNYRIADLSINKENGADVSSSIDKKSNMSGLSASVGISYNF